VFTLQPGQISNVMKEPYGLDIMKVNQHEPSHMRPLAEVQIEILQALKNDKADRAEQAASDQLDAAVRKHPKDLDAVAADMHMVVLDAPGYEHGGALPMLGASPAADEAIMALKPGEVSSVVTVGQNKAIFKLVEVLPSRIPEMAEVRDRLEKDYKSAKAIDLARERTQQFADKLKALGDLHKAAKEMKLEVKTTADLPATGRIEEFGQSADFPSKALSMKPGEFAGPVEGRGSLFYQVDEIKIATPDEVAKGRDAMRQQLLEEKRAAFFALYMDQLRARMTKDGKLSTNEVALNRLKASFSNQQ